LNDRCTHKHGDPHQVGDHTQSLNHWSKSAACALLRSRSNLRHEP